MKTNLVELLAPAKDFVSAVAAVESGADAVYIGGAKFGARHAAGNRIEEIVRVVEYAHQYGVRVHATLNTLLWDSELAEAEAQARELIAAGVDALIVQDMALRRMNLPAELHASTQMCNRSPEQAKFLGDCGFARVILERNLSLEQIRAICAATTAEVECFVHGAICVGYSGRCYLSRSMGPRSGNRGACSQPCRLTYDLTDGCGNTYIAGKHLLSVQDMNLSARMGDLLDAGVRSFKIEGRLKDVNYIRNVVAFYREALDRELAVRPELQRASVGESRTEFIPDPSKSFTRGESEYFIDGVRAGVASFDTPKSVGEFVGCVARTDRRSFTLDRAHTLAAGDGLCFGAQGTNVNAVEVERIIPNRMDGLVPGTEVYRNYDHRFSQQLLRSRTRRVIGVQARFEGSAELLCLRFTDEEGVGSCVCREGVFEQAKEPAKMAATLREQLARSGDTIFEVRAVEAVGEWFVPVSVIASMRREGLETLRVARLVRKPEQRILSDEQARYPAQELDAEVNVTNRLAEAFYRDHGVQRIVRGLDLEPTTAGRRVMRTAYCIRREIGECLRERPSLRGELYLVHGSFRYRLEFDCAQCEMSLIDCRDKDNNQ